MATFDSLRGLVLGVILIAVGWIMKDPEIGIKILVQVGWIFLIGGLIIVGLSIFSIIKR